jgi:hypothetical protein
MIPTHRGDDEYKCLKACKGIEGLEKRLNCIQPHTGLPGDKIPRGDSAIAPHD